MKTIATVLAVISTATSLLAQGLVNFANTSATLISAGSVAMPAGSTNQFIFAVFLAPPDTVSGPGQTVAYDDPRFQLAAAYNTNWPINSGRIFNLYNVDVTSAGGNPNNFGPGSTVDFVIRGWSSNAGATWAEALAAYLNWGSIPMYIGTSAVGDNLVLGGDSIPAPSLFGSQTWQVGGFDMYPPYIEPPCPKRHLTLLSPLTNQTVLQGGTATFSFGFSACPTPQALLWVFAVAEWQIIQQGGTQLVIANAQPTNAGRYFVECHSFWNNGGDRIISSATLTVLVPPTIATGPVSQTAEIGTSVRLSVRAAGDPPLVYRWLFKETNVLSITTNSVLELDNVGSAQVGSYRVAVTNAVGAVTSAPAMLSVIAPVERRIVPRLTLSGQLAATFNLEYSKTLAPTQYWAGLVALYLTNSPDFYFDLTSPLPSQRFYRAWQATQPTNRPSLGLNMIPALTLTGSPGDKIRVEGINAIGPTDAWFTLDTVTLTNTSQLFFDVSSVGQPRRLYRLTLLPYPLIE